MYYIDFVEFMITDPIYILICSCHKAVKLCHGLKILSESASSLF